MEKLTFRVLFAGTAVTCLVFLFLVVVRPPSLQDSTPTADAPGTGLPGFPLPDLQGKMVSPTDYQGKVVLINFWATWCGPCRHEIPDLAGLYRQYHDQGFEILGIALDKQGKEIVKPFVEKSQIIYPVLIGNDTISMAYSIKSIPTTLVLDRQGNIYKQLVGAQNRANFEALIKSLLH